jgi:hypothetical protein
MTRKLLSLLVMVGVGTMVANAHACDKHKSAEKTAEAKPCSEGCSGKCDPANCPHCLKKAELTAADGRSDSGERTPCSGEVRETKSEKASCCGSKAKLTKAAEEGAPCPHAAKAELTKSEEKASCHGAKAALTSAEDHGGCPTKQRVDAILTSLPSMKYKVGDELTGCSHSASKLAEANGGKIAYVVGEETFTDQGEATARLAKVLEDEIESMTVMQYAVGSDCVRCPMTAKSLAKKSEAKIMYRVGGFDFDSKEKAETALTAVKAALEDVKMSYKVGDTATGCSETAGKLAKENGGNMLYVVGDEETPCAKTAQLKLDQAKVHAIVEAAAGVAAS